MCRGAFLKSCIEHFPLCCSFSFPQVHSLRYIPLGTVPQGTFPQVHFLRSVSAAGVLVQGVVYAAFILAEEENSSEPLLAVMLKLDPSDGMTYKCLETEAELHGRHFWSTKIGLDIPTKCPWRLWRQLTSYGLIISGFVMEGNSRIPIQEWSLFLIVSPSLERLQGLILPETAQR